MVDREELVSPYRRMPPSPDPVEHSDLEPLAPACAADSSDPTAGYSIGRSGFRKGAAGADRRAEQRLDASREFASAADQVGSLLKPVSLTMVLVVLLVAELGDSPVDGAFSQLMVYHERAADDAGTIASGVLLNSAAVIGMFFGVTTLLLVLYKCRCYIVIYAWLLLSVASLLFIFAGYVLLQLCARHGVPLDAISFYGLMYNLSVGGTLLVFWEYVGCGPRVPLPLQQAYLVAISALLGWSATQLPQWSTWGLLAAVSIWDLIAVLTPRGPLKLLVEEAEARNEPIPGLVYSSGGPSEIKLGLGDFVFYSLLVGRASMSGAAPALACALAVLAGLCATLALLPVLKKVLPALPISIAVGILFYFTTELALAPLARFAATSGVFL